MGVKCINLRRYKLSYPRSRLDIINIFCTLIIVITTCISSYFSFQSVQLATKNSRIAESQEDREQRQEMYQLLKLAHDVYKTKQDQESSN